MVGCCLLSRDGERERNDGSGRRMLCFSWFVFDYVRELYVLFFKAACYRRPQESVKKYLLVQTKEDLFHGFELLFSSPYAPYDPKLKPSGIFAEQF